MPNRHRENTGRWSQSEHDIFINGLRVHGKEWKTIASLVGSRTVVQIRTHAQKYFQKLSKLGITDPVTDIQNGLIPPFRGIKRPRDNSKSKHGRRSRTSSDSSDMSDMSSDGSASPAPDRRRAATKSKSSTPRGKASRSRAPPAPAPGSPSLSRVAGSRIRFRSKSASNLRLASSSPGPKTWSPKHSSRRGPRVFSSARAPPPPVTTTVAAAAPRAATAAVVPPKAPAQQLSMPVPVVEVPPVAEQQPSNNTFVSLRLSDYGHVAPEYGVDSSYPLDEAMAEDSVLTPAPHSSPTSVTDALYSFASSHVHANKLPSTSQGQFPSLEQFLSHATTDVWMGSAGDEDDEAMIRGGRAATKRQRTTAYGAGSLFTHSHVRRPGKAARSLSFDPDAFVSGLLQ